jgi:hypothetical protein
MIFALSLVPLLLLVALSIDYAFYIQSRSQAALAADAAATHAVRAADAAYTYELSVKDPNASIDAQTAGQAIGEDWFAATLGTMPRATITGGPTVKITQNANGSAGFTATVSFAGTYPPFFAYLFNNLPWHINGASQAESAYQYVEILMLLDNSSSMLIATSASITQMEELTVCPSSGIASNFDGNSWAGAYYQNASPDAAGLKPTDVPETPGAILHYNPTTNAHAYIGTQESGTGYGYAQGSCNTGWQGTGGSPYAPCAFACHTTTSPLETPNFNSKGNVSGYTTNSAYTDDYYGLARQAGIILRLDDVQSAAAQVITAMQTNQQAVGQFSVGVYEFNDDVIPIWPAAANGQKQASEASTDLADASTAIQDAAIPLQANASIGNSDFPTSINDMISGKYSNGQQYRANAAGTTSPKLTPSGAGVTATTPEKDVFIVTDGMDDSSSSGNRVLGEMTGFDAESGGPTGTTPALCGKMKTSLGYTVYVLYIDYDPLGNQWYQETSQKATPYGAQDYPALQNDPTKYYAESTTVSVGSPPDANSSLSTVSPDEAALIGCASSPSDFFEATNDSQIGTAMSAMLHAALTSTIQLTQ